MVTRAAVKDFQKKRWLKAMDNVNRTTWQTLISARQRWLVREGIGEDTGVTGVLPLF